MYMYMYMDCSDCGLSWLGLKGLQSDTVLTLALILGH